ncbi:hypothetical protein GOA89_14740 [Sinorhizobium meliloti]|nr:hypothetical protein [Sinorhizobium meliloti]MDW9847554.1 hypothetical protein [Sinorhizobium meliloti]MDX0144063.1 hypothetical protein [Sinorhizobium meliloti]MDX0150488.1 hypothetical protein [Sinorhizobium meliloti]MDX0169732.1 hypothetical protein [Sinorhizobium meliloti]
MIRFLGFLAFLMDRLDRNVSDAAREFERRRQDRAEAKRLAWLLTLDPVAVREEGDLGSIILARQAEVAKTAHLQEGMARKGGLNREPSKVVIRPRPPGPMA